MKPVLREMNEIIFQGATESSSKVKCSSYIVHTGVTGGNFSYTYTVSIHVPCVLTTDSVPY